jgi:hypothetical protein
VIKDRHHELRALVVARVHEVDLTVPADVVLDALDAAASTGRALGVVAAALKQGPEALCLGAPPTVGRLVAALRARGSVLDEPTCSRCGRPHQSLTASAHEGAVCPRCRTRELAVACSVCQVVKPVYGRTKDGEALCSVCTPKPRRRCARCGRVKEIARRAHDGEGELCVSCFKGPVATCRVCGRSRPCNFVAAGHPICVSCSPRTAKCCAHCGRDRPACVRWPEGPVCEPCYRRALSRKGTCSDCGEIRRLVAPPGPGARRCATCAGVPGLATCASCGREERPYAHGRCVRCTLEIRARALLGPPDGPFEPLFQAIVSADRPYSVCNWLRSSGPASILGDLVSGALPLSHDALDALPNRRSADHLRHLLVAADLLPARNDALVALEEWVGRRLEEIDDVERRRQVHAYATWRVLNRARRRAQRDPRAPTATRHAKTCLNTAVCFLEFLYQRERKLSDCTQSDVDDWLADGPPSAHEVRDFLDWTAVRKTTPRFSVPGKVRRGGPKIDGDTRFGLVRRLLADESLDLSDRVAGCLVLLYGQQLSRIARLRRDQVTITSDGSTRLSLGVTSIDVPSPLDGLIGRLLDEHRHHTAFALPALATPWLFPGLHPGRPFNASQLGSRLRRLGVEPQAARRGALSHLAACMPAAVLAQVLDLAPTTAVRWAATTGGDWNRYAAELVRRVDRET